MGGVATELSDYDLFYGRRADNFGFAWQAFAGVRYELGSKWELGVVYKYRATTERYFDAFNAQMEGAQTQSLSVSMLFKF